MGWPTFWNDDRIALLIHAREVEELNWVKVGMRLNISGESARKKYTAIRPPAVRVVWRAWTQDEIETLVRMRETEDADWSVVAAAIGRTVAACEVHYSKYCKGRPRVRRKPGPRQRESQARINAEPIFGGQFKIPDDRFAERDARYEAAQRRTITQSIFGDPPPGFSHLDKVRSVASASPRNQNNETR